MNQQRATEGKRGVEWGKTAQPSPAQLPRTQGPGPEQCLLHQRACRQ